MLYIKDMNLVEILILSQSETKGQFNAFHHKEESEGSVHQTRFMKCGGQEEQNGKIQKPAELVREGNAAARAARPRARRARCHGDAPVQLEGPRWMAGKGSLRARRASF